ncbi:MAG: sodium:calcium antiporter [Planctomycetes bacterium]|nr:sodium:calcium antiporter [Planctomycetota bacterium]
MDTTQAFLLLGGGFLLLIAGAETLVRGASKIGLRMGMRPLTIGATIVAFGTSAPEFLVSIVAGLRDEPGIAIGNLVGSNIANIGLVLGLAAIVRPIPIDRAVLRLELPIAILATAVIPIIAWDSTISRTEGTWLLIGFAVFLTLYVLRATRSRGGTSDASPELTDSIGSNALLVGVGLGMLIGGSHLVVDGATAVATEFGLSKAAVGATIVAIGTSLPEVATTLVAALRGHHGIAIGNILGSNVFNLLFVLGPAAIINADGLAVGPLPRDRLIWLMLAMTVLLLPVMRFGKKISRWEGMAMLAAYGIFLLLTQQVART